MYADFEWLVSVIANRKNGVFRSRPNSLISLAEARVMPVCSLKLQEERFPRPVELHIVPSTSLPFFN